jgi:hypothetical protein
MSSQATSETVLGAVQHWVITTFWMTLGLLVGPLLLLAVPFFFVAIGVDWQELHEMAVAFLVVSPFVACFWTVMVNRWLDIRGDRESGTARSGARRAGCFVGAFALGFGMPIVAEFCYIAMSSGMAGVSDRAAWFLWFAGLDLAAFSPIILILARRSSS